MHDIVGIGPYCSRNKQGQFTMIDTVIEDVKQHGGGGGGAGVELL